MSWDSKLIDRAKEIIELYPQKRSALGPLLYLAQDKEGYIDDDSVDGPPHNPDDLKLFVPSAKGGLPSDIANAVLYLSSDLGQYVNGETLLVDGGMIASQRMHD